MKYLLPLLLITLCCTTKQPDEYSAMTFNIRYDTERDGINKWDNRKDWVVDIIQDFNPNFVGLQEALHHQVVYVDTMLANYDFIGVGRDDGKQAGEYTPLFYNKDKFRLLNYDTFWLSETPEEPSVGWDAALERICTYGQFESIDTGEKFYVFNAHLDHIGEDSRLNALKLINKEAKALNPEEVPVIIMGDLNATPDSPPIQFLNNEYDDSFFSDSVSGPTGTFHGFNPDHPLDIRIDYIFTSALTVSRYENIYLRRDDFFPSDHTPIFITFSL